MGIYNYVWILGWLYFSTPEEIKSIEREQTDHFIYRDNINIFLFPDVIISIACIPSLFSKDHFALYSISSLIKEIVCFLSPATDQYLCSIKRRIITCYMDAMELSKSIIGFCLRPIVLLDQSPGSDCLYCCPTKIVVSSKRVFAKKTSYGHLCIIKWTTPTGHVTFIVKSVKMVYLGTWDLGFHNYLWIWGVVIMFYT